MPYSARFCFAGLLLFLILLSCKSRRGGLPESQRNYSDAAINKAISACRSEMKGLYVFHHLNANSVARAASKATADYFGPDYSTAAIRNRILEQFRREFGPKPFGDHDGWDMKAPLDMSRLVCGGETFFWYRFAHAELSYQTTICLKKMLDSLGQYPSSETRGDSRIRWPRNRYRFIADYNIDITFRPIPFIGHERNEYYRVTLTDTIDLYSLRSDYHDLR